VRVGRTDFSRRRQRLSGQAYAVSLPLPSVVAYSVFISGGYLPTALSSEQLSSLAAHGAKARLLELKSEMAAIKAAFPALDGAVTKRSRSRSAAGVKKRRSKISAGGRRRIAEAQRKRWATLRSEAATSQRPMAGPNSQTELLRIIIDRQWKYDCSPTHSVQELA
jgi:hypothetical protein